MEVYHAELGSRKICRIREENLSYQFRRTIMKFESLPSSAGSSETQRKLHKNQNRKFITLYKLITINKKEIKIINLFIYLRPVCK